MGKLQGDPALSNLVAADGATGGFIKDSEAGNLPATATDDSADAGKVGEELSATVAQASPVSLTTDTFANIAFLDLTAGSWNVFAHIGFIPAASTSITEYIASITTTSQSLATVEGLDGARFRHIFPASVPGANPQSFFVGHAAFKLDDTTRVYLTARAAFSVSTLGGFGKIWAQRPR
jgi:hypothetical protein